MNNDTAKKIPSDESLVIRALSLIDADAMVFSEETHGSRIYIAEKSKECFQRILKRNDSLKAEVERLRAALTPFAEKWLPEDDMSPEDAKDGADYDEFMIKRDHIREARSALSLVSESTT